MGFKIESGLLDACALAILEKGDTYGYEITQSMKKAVVENRPTVPGAEKTAEGEPLQDVDQSYQGRNRRYYSITEEGKAKLLDYRCQWMDHKNAIDVFLDVKRAKE